MTDDGLSIETDQVTALLAQLPDKRIPEFITLLYDQLALEAQKELVLEEPSDTGYMRSTTGIFPHLPRDIEIGPTAYYAGWVALGTSRMGANPFHTRAEVTVGGRLVTIAGLCIKKVLEAPVT